MRDKVKESDYGRRHLLWLNRNVSPGRADRSNRRENYRRNHLDVVYLEAVHTVDAVNKARIAVEDGAHILVARGYQAKLIKEYTNIPVVEIRFHAQEIGLLIQKAKTILKKEHPHIALIAFENMLCDMSYMEQLFDIRLDVIYLKRIEEAESIIADFEERPDLIIGGEGTCRAAETMGYSTLFYQSTEESLKEALLAARMRPMQLKVRSVILRSLKQYWIRPLMELSR